MQPNLPFLLAASNAILKPGGLLRWNKRLMKDARLWRPLTEVIKIAKAKSEAWQTTCSSLSPKSNPKSVCSLFRSVAGSSSSFSSSPNFPNCSSPRESASFNAAYLRSHFSVSQPKALPSRARAEFRRDPCPEESHSSFCSPFSPTEFSAAASNRFSSTATGRDKVAYPMLQHLSRSGMDFLLHIFNLSWTLHFFPSI